MTPEARIAELEAEVERLKEEQLTLARDYDPNCDDFDFAYQREVMKSAFLIVEAVQGLAKALGRDPEGCLTTACECAVEVIDERDLLEQELKDATAANARLADELAGVREAVEKIANDEPLFVLHPKSDDHTGGMIDGFREAQRRLKAALKEQP
jgi:hypothetical protein